METQEVIALARGEAFTQFFFFKKETMAKFS